MDTPQFERRDKVRDEPVTFLMHMPDMGDIYYAPCAGFEAIYFIVYGDNAGDAAWGTLNQLHDPYFKRGSAMSRLIVYHHIKERLDVMRDA